MNIRPNPPRLPRRQFFIFSDILFLCISPLTAHPLFQVAFTLGYVLPFYLSARTRPSSQLSRDAPNVIRARIRTVSISCIITTLITVFVAVDRAHTNFGQTLQLLGWWPIDPLDVVKSLGLVVILFLGPLYESVIVDGQWQTWFSGRGLAETFSTTIGWRNYVAVSPPLYPRFSMPSLSDATQRGTALSTQNETPWLTVPTIEESFPLSSPLEDHFLSSLMLTRPFVGSHYGRARLPKLDTASPPPISPTIIASPARPRSSVYPYISNAPYYSPCRHSTNIRDPFVLWSCASSPPLRISCHLPSHTSHPGHRQVYLPICLHYHLRLVCRIRVPSHR